MKERFVQEFKKIFYGFPQVFYAPGSVNLVGEHTDYNDGFAISVAIDKYVYIAFSSRPDQFINIYSKQFDERLEYNLDRPKMQRNWGDYVFSVLWALKEDRFRISGADIYIDSEIPMSVGLNSSSAIQVAVATALFSLNRIKKNEFKIAEICQKAKNDFMDIAGGIKDPFIASFGRIDNAVYLDCRSFDYTYVPINLKNVQIIVCNTTIKKNIEILNMRKRECDECVSIFKRKYPRTSSLRDAYMSGLEAIETQMSDTLKKRSRYVINENDRTVRAFEFLKKQNYHVFGNLMNESQNSLKNEFEVSCKELDIMINMANGIDGVLGSKITGGGTGGCTVNLVLTEKSVDFINKIRRLYAIETKTDPEIYTFIPVDGAGEI